MCYGCTITLVDNGRARWYKTMVIEGIDGRDIQQLYHECLMMVACPYQYGSPINGCISWAG